jgi:hypothetical protein
MIHRKNPVLCAVRVILEDHNIEYSVSNGGKHLRVDFQFKGIRRRHTVPLSSSDWRAARNARTQVRRILMS